MSLLDTTDANQSETVAAVSGWVRRHSQ
jgi:hypothetical protein